MIQLIKIYRKYISPLKGRPTCIYVPTCSQYAIEALERFKKDNVGFWRNNFLEIEEIVNKCILNKMCCVEGFDVVALEEEG